MHLELMGVALRRGGDLRIQPGNHLLQLGELQRLGTPLLRWVQCLNALEHLADMRCSGGIGKALRNMPLRDRSQPLAQCIDGEHLRVLGQIARDAVSAGRQEATPFPLEMTDGGLIAAPRVIAGRSLQIPVDIRH